MKRYEALTDPECGDCWLVRCNDEDDPGIVAMCGQQRDAEMVAAALNDSQPSGSDPSRSRLPQHTERETAQPSPDPNQRGPA